MKPAVVFRDLGLMEYNSAYTIQQELHEKIMSAKLLHKAATNQNPFQNNYLLFCEHPHVYTIGKSGSEKNLLLGLHDLAKESIAFVRTNRGGDITYHGPGQIVGYPILDLDQFRLGAREYVWRLEESIIAVLKDFGIVAGRMHKASGVWLSPQTPAARKICALGIRISRAVTMHGFALNVNTDLKYYAGINPCGFTGAAVTSLQQETGGELDIRLVKQKLLDKIAEVFQMELQEG
jgi:lipoyl(octanoyl) transferase